MKKITTLVLSLVLVLAMSITAFAATNNEVIDALKKAGVSGDYLTQAESFLADNKDALTAADLDAIMTRIDEAKAHAGNVTDLSKLTAAQKEDIKNDILNAAEDIKGSVKVNVSFDAATNGIKVVANGKTYSASSKPVKATGVSTTATVAGIAVLAMGLVACGVAVSKKRFA